MFAGQEHHKIHWIVEFFNVRRPGKLVIAFSDHGQADGTPADGYDYLTVLLNEEAGQTRMTFRQGGGLPPEQLDQAKAGWQGFVEVLTQLLLGATLNRFLETSRTLAGNNSLHDAMVEPAF
jgi:hypothetical protein